MAHTRLDKLKSELLRSWRRFSCLALFPFFLICVSTELSAEPVVPLLEGIQTVTGSGYIAWFGYNNPNATTITLSIGLTSGQENAFSPAPIDRGQPKAFFPGRQTAVLGVPFDGSNLTWTLNGRMVTANTQSFPYTATYGSRLVAIVRHNPTINGGSKIDGSLQQLTGESATLNGGQIVGDWLVPGLPNLTKNGNPTMSGVVVGPGSGTPSGYGVTINSSVTLRYLVERIDAVTLSTVESPVTPTGTRSVSINNSSQSPGDFTTLLNLTLNSGVGEVAIPAGAYGAFTVNTGGAFVLGHAGSTVREVYSFQNLTLNSGSSVKVLGPVEIRLANSLSVNSSLGDAAHPNYVLLKLPTGNVALNSNATLAGTVWAPSGTLTLNSGSVLTGAVQVNRLTLNGGQLVYGKQPPSGSLDPVTVAQGADPYSIALDDHFTSPSYASTELVYTVQSNDNSALVTSTIDSTTGVLTLTFASGGWGDANLVIRATDPEGLFGDVPLKVTVQKANTPPTVSLTSPADNSTVIVGSTLTLSATATDSDGTVAKVEFFANNGSTTSKLGEATVAPYAYAWSGVGLGTYTLSAVATDNAGAVSAPSNLVRITVPVDSDGRGLPDAWELQFFGQVGIDPGAQSPAGDGYTILEEYQLGRNPLDFYQGQLPTLTIIGGNNQSGPPSAFLAQPLVVQVASTGNTTLINAPVTFSVTQGMGQLATTSVGAPILTSTLSARTDLNGQVTLYFYSPSATGATSQIAVTANSGTQSTQVIFIEQTALASVNAPTFSPDGGTYPAPQTVTISCDTENAVIHFTTNGDDPTESDPTIASGSTVTVDQSLTLKAKAWKTAYPASDIKSADYVIQNAAIRGVAAGGDHTFAWRVDGTLRAVGSNKWGELADGTIQSHSLSAPITGMGEVRALATGESHTLIVIGDGSVYAAGNNYFGQLGTGTLIDQKLPQKIGSLSQVIAVATGAHHSLFLTSDGSVWSTGLNAHGQLGLGSTLDQKVPVKLTGLGNIVAIAAGKDFSAALNSSGEVFVWGGNESGQLGLGTTDGQLSPVKIPGLTNVNAIVAGPSRAFAILTDQTVKGWGDNTFGALGDGTNENRFVPVVISGLSHIRQIAAGADHTLALTTDGNVLGFGANWNGQLGTGFGTTPFAVTPTPVSGLLTVTSIAAGFDHSIALQGSSAISVWGGNAQGALGLGSTQDQTTPQEAGGL